MTTLSLTSFLDVSILVEEVKVFCFVSNCACVIPPVEEIVFPEIVMFVPASKVFCFLFSSLSTYNFEVKCPSKVGVVDKTVAVFAIAPPLTSKSLVIV